MRMNSIQMWNLDVGPLRRTLGQLRQIDVSAALKHFVFAAALVFSAIVTGSQAHAQIAGSLVYEEDFEGTAQADLYGVVTGVIDQTGSAMSADTYWQTAGYCNGILLNNTRALADDSNFGTLVRDSRGRLRNCNGAALNNLGFIASALGGVDNSNIIVSSYTNNGVSGPAGQTIQLQTGNIGLIDNRFYTSSVDVGAQNCERDNPRGGGAVRGDPQHSFILVSNAGTVSLGPSVSVCDIGTLVNGTGAPVASTPRVATIVSPLPVRWSFGATGQLRLLNEENDSNGNDSGVDNLLLYDVTPQLEKTFVTTTSPVLAGETVTLRFTITNATTPGLDAPDNLQPKDDMSFTETLNANLEITGAATTTCGNGTVAISSSGTLDDTIAAAGLDLAAGEVSCVVDVPVRSRVAGDFVNELSNFSSLQFVKGPTAPANLTTVGPEAVDDATLVLPGETASFDLNPLVTNGGPDPIFTDVGGGTATGATISPDGTVSWDSTGFPPGDYTVEYQICLPNTDETATECSTATLTITVPPTPELTIEKSIADVADTNGNGILGDAGDTITYDFTVTNTGDTAMAGVTITDDLLGISNVAVSPTDLPIGQSGTLTGQTHEITTDNVADGFVENTAETTGVPSATNPDGSVDTGTPLINPATGVAYVAGEVTDDSDTASEPNLDADGNPVDVDDPAGSGAGGDDPTILTLPAPGPELTIEKSIADLADTNGNGILGDAGDTITYDFTVTNTGNTAMAGVTITDDLLGISAVAIDPTDLPIGESGTLTGQTYEITTDNVADGAVENTAETTGVPSATNADGTVDASSPLTNPDTGLAFEAGEVTDTSDTATEPELDADGNPVVVDNPAGSGAGGDDPTLLTLPSLEPELTIVKSIADVDDTNGNGVIGDAGDTITYDFTVTNTGSTAMAGVTITDALLRLSNVPVSPTDLAIGESGTLTGQTYEITPANVADGAVENTADTTGVPSATNADGTVDASSPLTNPDTGLPYVAGEVTDTSDTGTEPELDADGNPVDVDDPAGAGDGGDDPTILALPTLEPSLTVVKSTANVFDTNEDGLFGGDGDEVAYQFTVTNTGNVALMGVTLTDSIAVVDGGPIDLAIGQGDSVTFTATYIVQPSDTERGYIENTAEATGDAVNSDGSPLLDGDGNPISVSDTSDTGTDPEGETVSDPAGTETPDGLGNTDGDLGNDPTVTLVPGNPLPRIAVVKSVSGVTDNGDGIMGAGDTVSYTFTVTNTGNVPLGDVTVTDPLVAVTGGPISLAIGEANTTEFTATYVLTAADVAAGGVENTAEASGIAVNSNGDPILDGPGGDPLTATDVSDSGTEPEVDGSGVPPTIADPAGTESPGLDGSTDIDPTNDSTVLFIPAPGISVVKSVAAAPDTNGDGTFGGINDVLIYSFTVTNTGNTALTNVMVSDPAVTVSGGPINLPIGGIDTTTFTATYMLTANDVNVVGFVENSASVSGEAISAAGTPLSDPFNPGAPLSVTDVSDTGTDSTTGDVTNPEGTETEFGGNGDGDPTNDPTITQLPVQPMPDVQIIKSVAAVVDTNADAVVGGVDDVATYQFDVTNTGNTFLANVAVNDPVLGGLIGTIPSMAVGETVTLTVDYTIVEADQDRGYIENTATAEGEAQNPLGTPLLDPNTGQPLTASDDSDTATDASADPVPNPSLTETPDGAGATDGDPTNDPTVLNVPLILPDTMLSGFVFFDTDTDETFDAGEDGLAGFVVNLRDADGNIIATTVTNADGFYEFAGFPIGTYDVEFVNPNTNEVVGMVAGLAFASDTVLTDVNQPVIAAAGEQLTLTKTTPLTTVSLGSSVPYTITIENASTSAVTADIVDSLPVGFSYTPGTATIGGVPTEPIIAGSSLTWTGVTVAAGATQTLELVTRVGPGAPTGELVNTVNALDPVTGGMLATPATAVVRREVEAVFECSDVIGKVFDDVNFDGYQNSGNTGGLTNQNIFRGKNKVAPPVEARKEPGLPRVRLVTGTGTIITTDEYGRYSVPCAELPRQMGSNFTLKLDERSLPTGYRVTTENPRTMRLTAGIMTEMNFGAALGRVIDIDLTAAAFDRENAPVARLTQGIDRLLGQVASEPTVLRLSYFSTGENTREANRKLERLEKHIQARWRKVGNYRLIVERNIKSLQ